MRRVRWDVGEERTVLVLLDKHRRCIEEDVGAISLIGFGAAVELQNGVEVAVAGRVRGLPDAASLVDQRLAEALVDRPHGIVVAQVPFAEDPGLVSGFREHLGQGNLVAVHHGAADIGVDDARAVVVASCHQAGASRRANRRHIETGKFDALARQPVEVGRLQNVVAAKT